MLFAKSKLQTKKWQMIFGECVDLDLTSLKPVEHTSENFESF